MDKETTTSVTIDRKTFARLDRLAKSNNVSKKYFLSCALEYFEKYGINPVEHESPAKEMQKLIKRCDLLLKNQQAIYARLEAVTQRQEKIFSYIASYIDAKGKAGLFDDIKALYKDEKNKREKI